MKIGLDMDEVLCDLLSEYIKFLNSEYDMSLSQKHFNGYYAWDTWKGTIEEKIKLFDEFYKSKYFKNIKPIKEVAVLDYDFFSKEEVKKLKLWPATRKFFEKFIW